MQVGILIFEVCEESGAESQDGEEEGYVVLCCWQFSRGLRSRFLHYRRYGDQFSNVEL
jgi:hypothetical protein